MFFNQLGHYCRFETDRVVYLIFCSPGGDCCFQISMPQSCSSEPTTTCQWMSCREITIDNSQTLLKPFLQVEKRKAQKVWWSIFNWFFYSSVLMIVIEDADFRGDFQMKGSLVSEGASKTQWGHCINNLTLGWQTEGRKLRQELIVIKILMINCLLSAVDSIVKCWPTQDRRILLHMNS